MILEIDATGLEVVGAGYLSQCPVLIKEILAGIDIHGENEKSLGIPRLTAKRFMFRLIYGGNEYSYANDPEFNHISRRSDYWKRIIDNFYIKYYGLQSWHERLVSGVQRSGLYTSPTGRQYFFKPQLKRGVLEWPRTTILNYPVQGLGADIMSVIRVSAFKRFSKRLPEVLFVNTVHDSIVLDTESKYTDKSVEIMKSVFSDFPRNFHRVFGSQFNLPLTCKIKAGPDWGHMKEI